MTRKINRRAAIVGTAGVLASPLLAQMPTAASPWRRNLTPVGAAWPEADAMFKKDQRWRGGDLALSNLLRPGEILWHFGDSFIDLEPPYQREGSTFIRNSIAIQRGTNPLSADIEFHWSMQNGVPRAFFDADQSPVQREPSSLYWAHSSFVVDDGARSVLATIFGEWTHTNPVQRLGSTWAFVANYNQHPSNWEIVYAAAPDAAAPLGASSDPRYWSLTQQGTGYVEGYGNFQGVLPGNPVYQVRWAVADLLAGNVSNPEWKDGDTWRPQSDFTGTPPAQVTFPSPALQFSVHRDQTGYTMVTQDGDLGPMAWDHAPRRDGAWGQQFTVIYDPPERHWPEVLVYHNWAAPAVTSADADLVAVYCTNGPDVFVDESTYYPRFVKIHYQ